MSTIRFIEARFFDPSERRFELEKRLKRRLRLLRCQKAVFRQAILMWWTAPVRTAALVGAVV